jgi:DNA-binding CsgD family transcriptional regulator
MPETLELTPREMEAAKQVHTGRKRVEIAKAMGITRGVLDNMLNKIYIKLGICNERQLVLWYERSTWAKRREKL